MNIMVVKRKVLYNYLKRFFLLKNKMVNLRKVSISDEIFSYYTTLVDLDEVDNINDIIDIITKKLENLLKKNNLESLVNLLSNRNFHIHDFTFEQILLSKPEKEFWVCSHC